MIGSEQALCLSLLYNDNLYYIQICSLCQEFYEISHIISYFYAKFTVFIVKLPYFQGRLPVCSPLFTPK